MYFSSHSSDKQYFSSQKIDENVVFLATTQDKSGLTRQELQCVVTRNETLSGYRNCIPCQSFTYQTFQIKGKKYVHRVMSTSLILMSVLSLAIWEAKFTPYKQSPSVQVSKCVQCAQMSKCSQSFTMCLCSLTKFLSACICCATKSVS